jgi:hypothetical protein
MVENLLLEINPQIKKGLQERKNNIFIESTPESSGGCV